MILGSVRLFLLEKRERITAVADWLAQRGCQARLVHRESEDGSAYAGCSDPEDQVLEIAEPQFDWSGLLLFAKQRQLDFCVVCDTGFRGIRFDHCPSTSLPLPVARV